MLLDVDALQVKRTSSWNKACEELKRYQKQLEKLREETENFTKPFVDSSSDESDVPEGEETINIKVPTEKKSTKNERPIPAPATNEMDSEAEEEKEEKFVVEKEILPNTKNDSLLKLTIVSL